MAQFLSCSLLSLILALTNSLSFGQTPFRFHFETVAGNMAELKNLNIADIDNAAFADLRRAYEQIPEAELDNTEIGKKLNVLFQSSGIIEFAVKIGSTWKCKERIENIAKLQKLMDSPSLVAEETLKDAALSTGLPWVEEKFQDILKFTADKSETNEYLKKKFSGKLKQSQKEMAENLVKHFVISSSVIIIVQLLKIYYIWMDIKKAKNLTKEAQAELGRIEVLMTDLSNHVSDITNKIGTYDAIGPENQLIVLREINLLLPRTTLKFIKVLNKIGALEIKVGGLIERIEVRREEHGFDAITNLVQGVAGIFQYFSLQGSLSTGCKIAQGFVTASHFTLFGLNCHAFVLSGIVLEQLRCELERIRNLNIELEMYYDKIEDAEEWCKARNNVN